MNRLQIFMLMTVLLFFINGTANRATAQKPLKNGVLYVQTDAQSTETETLKATAGAQSDCRDVRAIPRKASENPLRGDVNHDNKVTIADVTALVDIILSGISGTIDPVTDVNNDGQVTIADVTLLVDIILGKVLPDVPFDPWDGTGEALTKKR